MNITHKQHYVQQQYLSSWENEHQLWVYDKIYNKSEQKGKKAICYEIDYYKLQRLTDDEKRIFYALYKNVHPQLKNRINELNALLDNEITIESADEKIAKNVMAFFQKKRQEIENLVFAQFGESLVCDIEKGLSKDIWERLFAKDDTIIYDEQNRVNLYSYVIGQTWRVPSKRNKIEKALESLTKETNLDISVERMFPYFVYYQSMIESAYMSYYNTHKLVYLRTKNSDIEFLTSDNPVINLCEDFDESGCPKRYEFYWALTPRLALLITENMTEGTKLLSDEEVDAVNKKICYNATRYIISHKRRDELYRM